MSTTRKVAFSGVFDARSIRRSLAPLFDVKESHLREALAAAAGFRTHAAQRAAPGRFARVSGGFCDYGHFCKRLAELTEVDGTAEAVTAILEGAVFSIHVQKHPPQKYDGTGTVQYAVQLAIEMPDGAPASHHFELPNLFGTKGEETCRVDSWHEHRHFPAAEEKSVLRSLTDAGRFIDGVWKGELFVYDPVHWEDDRGCLSRVVAALARAALRDLAGGIYCTVSRPQDYDYGAWRVEVELGSHARGFLGKNSLFVERPELKGRFFHLDDGFRSGEPDGLKLIHGKCLMDVYTNGEAYRGVRTSPSELRKALINKARASLERAGWVHASAV